MSECEAIAQRMFDYSSKLMHNVVDDGPQHLTRFTQGVRTRQTTPAKGWKLKPDDLTLWLARVSMHQQPDDNDEAILRRAFQSGGYKEDLINYDDVHPDRGTVRGSPGTKLHVAFKDV
jgi:hypothetical protein